MILKKMSFEQVLVNVLVTGLKIVIHWSPLQPKIEHWQLNALGRIGRLTIFLSDSLR